MSSIEVLASTEPTQSRVNEQPETNQPKSSTDDISAEQAEMTKRAKHHKKWNRRLKVLFCCLGYKKNKESIADVASIFAEFYADLDVPSSDLAAGFVLLSKYQDAQRQWVVKNQQSDVEQYLSSVPIKNDSNFLDISTADDSHLINDLIYYMNYSLAIFGWPMQMVDDPCMLCCICPYLNVLRCSSRRQNKATTEDGDKTRKRDKKKNKSKSSNDSTEGDTNSKSKTAEQNDLEAQRKRQPITGELDEDFGIPIILEDNCCGCNFASVERRLRAHNYEIIYVSYKVSVNVVPFLVAADHSKQSVVVAMRGSMSLSDMITDMNGQTDKIPIEDCPDDWLSHRGITRASSYVKSTLMEEKILDRAFNCRPDLGSNNYNLILCGHSLGAGVAAILGILLRKNYPSLKAYLYSPPGGILSLPAVEYTKQFATGILLGNDCVPRLGVAQLERLRYHLLLSLKSSQKSTGKILAKALCPTCCFGGNKVEYDPDQSLNLLYGTEGRSFDYNGSKIPFQVQPQVLYVPGRLIHIVKNHSFKSRRLFKEPIFQALWTDNIVYDRVMVSEGMFYDHLPNNLMHAMKMLFSKTLPARKDSKTVAIQEQNHIVANGHVHIRNSPQVEQKNDVIRELVERRPYGFVIKDENNNGHVDLDENNNEVYDRNKLEPSSDINFGPSTPLGKETADNQIQNPASTDKNIDDNGNDETFINKNL